MIAGCVHDSVESDGNHVIDHIIDDYPLFLPLWLISWLVSMKTEVP